MKSRFMNLPRMSASHRALLMQKDAEGAGGRLVSLMGNHELMLLSVRRSGGFESRLVARRTASPWMILRALLLIPGGLSLCEQGRVEETRAERKRRGL